MVHYQSTVTLSHHFPLYFNKKYTRNGEPKEFGGRPSRKRLQSEESIRTGDDR
jgi:hypothetical protein